MARLIQFGSQQEHYEGEKARLKEIRRLAGEALEKFRRAGHWMALECNHYERLRLEREYDRAKWAVKNHIHRSMDERNVWPMAKYLRDRLPPVELRRMGRRQICLD